MTEYNWSCIHMIARSPNAINILFFSYCSGSALRCVCCCCCCCCCFSGVPFFLFFSVLGLNENSAKEFHMHNKWKKRKEKQNKHTWFYYKNSMMKWEKFNWVSRFWCFVRKHALNSYNYNIADTRTNAAKSKWQNRTNSAREWRVRARGSKIQINKNHFNLERKKTL